MKNYFQKAFSTFKDNCKLYLILSLCLGIIFSASIFFLTFFPFMFLLILFLILPLFVSINAIAMKTATSNDCGPKDLYFGYRNFTSSLVLTTKVLMKPVLMGFLAYFLIAAVGSSILISVLYFQGSIYLHELFNLSFVEIMNGLATFISDDSRFLYITYAALIVSMIVAYNIYLRRSLSPFVCFETTFTLDSAKKMSINLTKKKNKFLMFNNIFLAMYLILIVVAEMFQMIYFTQDKIFSLYYFFTLLIIFILMAPLIFINALFIFYYYDENHRSHVINLYKEYLNVNMRTTQDKVIDEDINKNDKLNQ